MSTTTMTQRLLSLTEVCTLLHCKEQTISRWRKQGLFPEPVRSPGRRLLFDAAQVEELLSSGMNQNGSEKPAKGRRRAEE